MKYRIFESQTDGKPFRFLADSKELAIDHVIILNQFPCPEVHGVLDQPKQIGYTEDYAGLDLDDESTWR